MASINRNFRGLGREMFTDTGQYVIRFDSAGTELALPPGSEANLQGQTLVLPDEGKGGLTLDQRAMVSVSFVRFCEMLIGRHWPRLCLVCISTPDHDPELISIVDFDYFSRHSGAG